MAKKQAASSQSGKPLVIVESPKKAKTIGSFLGNGYTIEASIGHVRDLPEGKKEVPASYKQEDWAYLGVNVHENFQPIYIVPSQKKDQVKKLKDLVKNASELYLATDEDREGEAISWHLYQVLNPKVPVHRMVFHEITQKAIQEALANPRDIDEQLVHAQETRRIVDRLFGYDVSPLLWRKVRPKLSAGRVQSVAVRLIVQRERERIAFRSATYWDLLGTFAKQQQTKATNFDAGLISVDGKRLASSKDFDPSTGKLKDPNLLLLKEEDAEALRQRLKAAEFKVASVEDKPRSEKPYAPFTTSTMQQEAHRKLRFGSKRTMQIAQSLYENGYITYMRTDSTNLSTEAIDSARDLVKKHYGDEYLPAKPRVYQSKVKNAQEAHEAIRPSLPFTRPEELKTKLNADEFKLYDLIWKRTVASQMSDAKVRYLTVIVEGNAAATAEQPALVAQFRATGKTIDFYGYMRAYVEGSDDPEADLADKERMLPALVEGEGLDLKKLDPKSHTTQPPARFTESSLTGELEGRGIGRPSTYASIIDTILQRHYVWKKGEALVPTWTAMVVVNLLEQHLPDLVDYEFTARMEDDLDAISRGEADHTDYLNRFYFGEDQPGLKKRVDAKVDEVDAREISSHLVGKPESGEPIYVRVGRYGPYLSQGERRGKLPDQLPPDELSLERAQQLIEEAAKGEEPIGHDPQTNQPIYVKTGRFGPYVERAAADDEEKPHRASLLKGMSVEEIDLPTALRLLSLPRNLGKHSELDAEIIASNGQYGPYIRCGSETRSLPADISPLDVTYEQAVELLAKPKQGRKKFGAKREPINTLGESPVTGNPVQLFDGQYGLYVSDGETNASLPKDSSPDELTLAQALELLAKRAAEAPKKKKKAAKKKTTTAKKKTTKKKAKKKAASKKSG